MAVRGEPSGVAVIFAGGSGARMGGQDGRPKQLIEVCGKPILAYTLEHFQAHPHVDSIYVVSLESCIPEVCHMMEVYGFGKVRAIVPGGTTAHASIVNGLRAALQDGADRESVVFIHDGVRPMINAKLIDDNFRSVVAHGNAISSIPAFETVASVRVDAAVVDEVADRSRMHVLQAPQSFRLGEVYDLNAVAERDGFIGRFVDQAHLMYHYGQRLHLVPGLRGNVKITVPLDVVFFTHLVESGEYKLLLQGAFG